MKFPCDNCALCCKHIDDVGVKSQILKMNFDIT